MKKEDKIKRLISVLKGEPIDEDSIHILIFDKTCDPIMVYDPFLTDNGNLMENGVPITKEECKAHQAGDQATIEIIKNRLQANSKQKRF